MLLRNKQKVIYICILVLTMIIMLTTSAKVNANTQTSAETILINKEKSYTYTASDDTHYYKFTPSATGYYEINVSGANQKDSYIDIIDNNGTEVAYTDFDQSSNKLYCAYKMAKGKIYCIYVYTSIYNDSKQKLITKVTSHSHKYKVINKDIGINNQACQCPCCYYFRYRITARPIIYKLTKGKQRFRVYWKCNISEFDGYQVQYSLKKNFRSRKTVAVSYRTTAKTITKLKKKKKYYVRVRAYIKAIQNDGSITKNYGPWSKVKYVKTK